MNIHSFVITDRLSIEPLAVADQNFIFELVNTEGWIRFIGDRNVRSDADAIAYIQKILDAKNISYWVVKLKEKQDSIGIITFIQRDYLEHPDIGFAFLPAFAGMGYAYEATIAVLDKIVAERRPSHILATTVPGNISSIRLLTKIGLIFDKEINVGEETLHVYGIPTDKLQALHRMNR